MGRSEKEKEGKGRGTNAPPAASDAVAALGNLHTAAALETLLKSAQGVAAAPAQLPNEAQQLLLAGGFGDPLQSLARNNALLSRLTKNALPRSAPVSSLLPPLPPEGLSPQALLALQAQLGSVGASPAALLGAAGGACGGHAMHGGGTDLTALQQLLAVQAAAATPKHSVASSITSSITPDMQGWSLERLEQHVNLLNQLKQAVPESVAVLLADARRKEAKRTAKRLANRKSASSSRARKKALVQEMTELNARLKRQAQILALLPDLVITINVDGVITFCSAQVERVLHHKIDDILGAQLADLLVPTSKDKLNRLVAQLIESEQLATLGVAAVNGTVGANESGNDTEQALGNAPNNEAGAAAVGENSSEIAVVSEPSFPLSVVKVKAKDGPSAEIDNSDNSASNPASKGPSSLTQESSIPRSPTASSLGNSDDAKSAAKAKDGKKAGLPSSDTSNSSSLSTTAKKVQKANQNLEKNVRAHNKKMKKKGCPSYRDDVTGADVTANNASARLSSLQHRPESSSEEDSGYRESNDSREETSSSASDSSASNGRRKPIAPTCTICLVRKDLTTIWCEVTSSIRTVEINRDGTGSEGGSEDGKSRKSGNKVGAKSEEGSAPSESEIPPEKELLLCLRPIRDGDKKMAEKMRFGGLGKKLAPGSPARSDGTNTKPPKKRRPDAEELEEEPAAKKASTTPQEGKADTEEVAESLMAMNKTSDD